MNHVLKGLYVVEHVMMYGNDKFVSDLSETPRVRAISQLKNYRFFQESKEIGKPVRDRAQRVVDLLSNEEKLGEERRKAGEVLQKMKGYSNETYVHYKQERKPPSGEVEDRADGSD